MTDDMMDLNSLTNNLQIIINHEKEDENKNENLDNKGSEDNINKMIDDSKLNIK